MGGLAEEMQPKKAFGWAARDTSGVLSPLTFSRRFSFFLFMLSFILLVYLEAFWKLKWFLILIVCRATGEKDVSFKVLYCGICHSDLHMLKNEWGNSTYPLVPGYVFLFPNQLMIN